MSACCWQNYTLKQTNLVVYIHAMEEIDVAFIKGSADGMYRTKEIQNVTQVKGSMKVRLECLVGEKFSAACRITPNALIIGLYLVLRHDAHVRNSYSGDKVHEVSEHLPLLTNVMRPQPDERYWEMDSTDDPPLVCTKLSPLHGAPI